MKILTTLVLAATSSAAFAGHGAIAYSPSTGRVGWTYGYVSGHAARWNAISEGGIGDCTWQVEEHDEYAVLVRGAYGSANCAIERWIFN